MRRFVLDCSIAMSWCFQDESNPYSEHVLDMLNTSEAAVPWLWPLEVANVLLVGERRGRLSKAETARFLSLLQTLPISIDNTPPNQVMDQIMSLGRQHNLSSYDAVYLELAMREGLGLATLDDDLKAAAAAVGVDVVTV